MTVSQTPGITARMLFMLAALAAGASCEPSLSGKDRCRTDGDCAGGRVCTAGVCMASNPGNAVPLPSLFIAAHTDDLLFFMNPDVEAALRPGKATRTVVVSSGDALGEAETTRSIESQTLAVFATMAGVESTDWLCAMRPYAGKATLSCQHASAPSIDVTFLRLQASQFPEVMQVPRLWGRDLGDQFSHDPVATLRQVVEDGDAYSREDLVAVLAAIIDESQAQHVGIPDPTWTYGVDDPDNTAVGRFAMEAAHRANASPVLRIYRGYNLFVDWEPGPVPEIRNLTQAERDRKAELLHLYSGLDVTQINEWDEWCWRRYTLGETRPGRGALRVSESCLQPPATAGESPTLTVCDDNSPTWELGADHTLRAPGGGCLTLAGNERTAWVTPCAASPGQKWTLLNNGQLQGMNGGCLSRADGGLTVTAAVCGSDQSGPHFAVTANQRWTLGAGPSATP